MIMQANPELDFWIRYGNEHWLVESAGVGASAFPHLVMRVSKRDSVVWSFEEECGPSGRGVGWTSIGCRLALRRQCPDVVVPYIVVFADDGEGDVLYAFPLSQARQKPRPVCEDPLLEYLAKQFRREVYRVVIEFKRKAA